MILWKIAYGAGRLKERENIEWKLPYCKALDSCLLPTLMELILMGFGV